MWYGNAREDDMDWGQFCIMFRALYLEGMGRPHAGIRLILKNLVRKFRSLGGELKLRSGVSRIQIEGDRAVGVVLDNGQELTARNILSSAGAVETLRLCDAQRSSADAAAGQLSFVESLSVLDRQPKSVGCDRDHRLLQRLRQVPLAKAGERAVRRADRRHLLAEQFRLLAPTTANWPTI